MSRLNIVKQLILDHEFETAQQLLEKETHSEKSAELLSYLYRFGNDYQKEQAVIQKTAELFPNNAYINERKSWYQKPLIERLVPRQPLVLPRDPEKIPSQHVLEQMCFVTAGGSDTPYFQMFVQLLESIRNTRLYKDITICILDAGLTDEHKDWLHKTFSNLMIKDPGWDFDIPFMNDWRRGSQEMRNGMKGCTSRPFIDQHFPGYRYYMWMDTDTWLQDERSIDEYLYNAQKYGLGLAWDHVHETWANNFWIRKNETLNIYPKSYDEFLNPRYYYTAGSFCIDVETGVFDLWRKSVLETVPNHGFSWGNEEINFVYAVNTFCKASQIPTVERTHHFSWFREGMPVLGVLPDVLYMPSSLKPLGIIHLIGSFLTKEYPIFPMLKAVQPLTPEQCEQNKRIYMSVEQGCGQNNCLPDQIRLNGVDVTYTSYHYRTWPWADKPQIRELLMKEAQECLTE